MKIVVTGGTGFIGRHLVRELEENGHEVVALGRRDGDLGSPGAADALVARHRPDVVAHLAARVERGLAPEQVEATIRANALMTALVARACGDRGVRLAYASTTEVYGARGEDVCREDDPLGEPGDLYALSKRWGEEAAALLAPANLAILRLSTPYGPGIAIESGRGTIATFLHRALHRQRIPVYEGVERSWCWVGDTAAAIRLVLERREGGVFNIGRDDDRRSLVDVAELACELAGASRDLIEPIHPRGAVAVNRFSTERIEAAGWSPRVELEDGMRETLDWVRKLAPPAAA